MYIFQQSHYYNSLTISKRKILKHIFFPRQITTEVVNTFRKYKFDLNCIVFCNTIVSVLITITKHYMKMMDDKISVQSKTSCAIKLVR